MKSMMVKICGLTDKENILNVLELDPDFIGFIFYPPSPRYVVGKVAEDDVKYLKGRAIKTGVFVNYSVEQIIQIVQNYGLGMVQLHGEEAPSTCRAIKDSGIGVMKAFSIDPSFDFRLCEEYAPFCKYFLFDRVSSGKGGSGQKFDWELLNNYTLNTPWFLSGGISPDDAPGIRNLGFHNLAGVDLNSKFETSPGIKDTVALKKFMDKIKKEI